MVAGVFAAFPCSWVHLGANFLGNGDFGFLNLGHLDIGVPDFNRTATSTCVASFG